MVTVRQMHNHYTRRADNLYLEFSRSSFSQNVIVKNDFWLYNALPNSIKATNTLKEFKTLSKEYVLQIMV